MITRFPSETRGRTRTGWLDARHSFSFGRYHDPDRTGHGPLVVINEDRFAPGGGFGLHPHRDMEIITIVLSGALRHADSLGHEAVIGPGEVQRISAGTGIRHAEHNPSGDTPVHLLQIWITPSRAGLDPSYDQRALPDPAPGAPLLVASPDGRAGSLRINQDATLSRLRLPAGRSAEVPLSAPEGRRAWVQVIAGGASVLGVPLAAGDGAAVEDEPALRIEATAEADLLLFDLP